MRVLIAPDKFKGSLTALEAAQQIAEGWEMGWPGCDLRIHPLADGGDGTLDAVAASVGGEWVTSKARNAQGRDRESLWLWQKTDAVAWIEIARVCGLASLAPETLDPHNATSAGVGELIKEAVARGAKKVFLCLGGSATNDAGCGMASALGFTFLDANGNPLPPLPSQFPNVATIQPPASMPSLTVTALTDVSCPLLGSDGTTYVYAPQKGATTRDLPRLESAVTHISKIILRDIAHVAPSSPGAGAAGGLGFGVLAFLQGTLQPGFQTISNLTRLPAAIAQANLIITGEGKIDSQTFTGKTPAGVAALAREYRKPVIAFAGTLGNSHNPLSTFDAIYPLRDETMPLDYAMKNAAELLQIRARKAAKESKERAQNY